MNSSHIICPQRLYDDDEHHDLQLKKNRYIVCTFLSTQVLNTVQTHTQIDHQPHTIRKEMATEKQQQEKEISENFLCAISFSIGKAFVCLFTLQRSPRGNEAEAQKAQKETEANR